MTITIKHCKRCGHEWASKLSVPTVCPKCKSPYWNTPKQGKDQGGKGR